MADKKITELTELPDLKPGDLFVVVDNPAGTPITKKIYASNIFANGISYVTNGEKPGTVVLRSVLTANVNTTAALNTLIAGEFVTNALGTSANTEYQYALRATSKLHEVTSNVTKEHAVAKFVLDVSNAAALISNTHGLIIQVANTGVRTQNVTSFIRLENSTQNSTDAQTKYLFDANNVSVSGSGGETNATTLFSNSAASVATHKLRVRVNGVDYWLLATDTAS